MRFDFRTPHAIVHAPDWRDVDHLLYRWTRAIGGTHELARCAARLSLAESQGHTALPLDGDDAAACRASALVGDGRATTPFVLDADDHFYFWRGHAAEVAVAEALTTRATAETTACDGDDAAIAALFDDDVRNAAQRQAVQAALTRRLVVLTGGPGTGKTTTVLRMLLALQQRAAAPLAIHLAAPTGKAAQRLQQAIVQGQVALAPRLDASWRPALDAMSALTASTLHRLLEFDPRHGRWRRNSEQPLASDVVVVDEASMLDLDQMRALLAALPAHARLILVGDADQLASIAAGAVLTDAVRALAESRSASLVRLEHVFRATPELGAAHAAIRQGDAGALRAAYRAGVVEQHPLPDAPTLRHRLSHWADMLAEVLRRCDVGVAHDAFRAAKTLQAIRQRQLLCALRESAFGVVAVNAVLQSALAREFGAGQRDWFPGRIVMITRNDDAHGLFNGDVGIALPDEEGRLKVWFEGDVLVPARAFVPGLLPAHDTAYAITIHKSQGSEYEHVAVLLPPSPESPILSRQLLYTAASRGKQSLSLWANDDVIDAALARPLARSGGLQSKLRDALRKTS
jgi:exodeoxyribonuclease V alpha subunit